MKTLAVITGLIMIISCHSDDDIKNNRTQKEEVQQKDVELPEMKLTGYKPQKVTIDTSSNCDSLVLTYDDKGRKLKEGCFYNSKKEGCWIEWQYLNHPNGSGDSIKREYFYKNGQLTLQVDSFFTYKVALDLKNYKYWLSDVGIYKDNETIGIKYNHLGDTISFKHRVNGKRHGMQFGRTSILTYNDVIVNNCYYYIKAQPDGNILYDKTICNGKVHSYETFHNGDFDKVKNKKIYDLQSGELKKETFYDEEGNVTKTIEY